MDTWLGAKNFITEMVASIIITTMNRGKLLEERSLRSALSQNFKDYEIIVVDDAGNDDTEERMKKHPVRYYRFHQNQGLSYARNFGIKKAKGEYVVCLDDDNELLPNFLKETINCIQEYAVDAVGVGRIIQYKDFARAVIPHLSKFTSIDWGWLIKKSVFDNTQYDNELRANEDTDFGIRFEKKYLRVVIRKPLCVAYDCDDPKMSLSFPNERELSGMKKFLEKNLHEYIGYANELRYVYRLAGRKFYRGGFRLKGLNYFWKSFLAYPSFNSFIHLFFILFGWTAYNAFMTFTEKI